VQFPNKQGPGWLATPSTSPGSAPAFKSVHNSRTTQILPAKVLENKSLKAEQANFTVIYIGPFCIAKLEILQWTSHKIRSTKAGKQLKD